MKCRFDPKRITLRIFTLHPSSVVVLFFVADPIDFLRCTELYETVNARILIAQFG